jgi:hypothetical protein
VNVLRRTTLRDTSWAGRSSPTPSISHSSLSPATVVATPERMPGMMTSPGASAIISELHDHLGQVPDHLPKAAVRTGAFSTMTV